MRTLGSLAVALVALAFVAPAAALPERGAGRPAVRLVDAWDRALELATLRGRPVLVLYEDKDSSGQNAALKEELARLARGDRYRDLIAVVPVADVGGYDYWPVRGFVKDAIRDESRRVGAPIFCDWDGAARAALGVRRGVSSVVLYDAAGRVAWAHEGAAPVARRLELVALLRAMIGEA